MNSTDCAVQFACEGATLFGILSVPARAQRRGVLIVVGGPQYRAGSHRQFALLARDLAARGIPTLRFDYRGMGDSQGAPRPFDTIDADVRSAIDCFFQAQPLLTSVVLWGLCDGACAATFYAPLDPRVDGLVLLNPWVRTSLGLARAQLRHYYLRRLLAPQFWRTILLGRLDYATALRSLRQTLVTVLCPPPAALTGVSAAPDALGHTRAAPAPLAEKMCASLTRFEGSILLILSGHDLTAREFLDTTARAAGWQALLRSGRVTRHDLALADHTFSRRVWRDQVMRWTHDWMVPP